MRKLAAYTAAVALGVAAVPAPAQQTGTAAETGKSENGGSGSLTSQVASNLANSGNVDAAKIDVEPVSDIAVELTGTVPTNGEKQEASVVAIRTENVQFVRNRLEIDTSGN